MEYPIRLNRFLSACGLGSRRGCEELISGGRVRINGSVCTALGTQVGPQDAVVVDGCPVRPRHDIVIALHKPVGHVCTRSDERGRRTIYDLLPPELHSLHHVGRLDRDSSGLLLLTNRGDLSHRLSHPSRGVEKEYEVTVEEPVEGEALGRLVRGMMTPEGFAKAERAWAIGERKIGIVLKQGLKRQIRHMLYQLGHGVRRLERLRVGSVFLKGIPAGGWRELDPAEVARLLASGAGGPSARSSRRPR